jgi:hypothetical protein
MKLCTPENVDKIAREFSRILRSWLTDDELLMANAANEQETESCCHTQDYCDANEAMLEAISTILKMKEDVVADSLNSDEMESLWSKAWDHAATNYFWYRD